MSCATQPCFVGHPKKIKLARDHFCGNLRALMLQIHDMKHAVSSWRCLQDLGCARLSNFGSESSWLAPMVALSLQGSIALVALFMSASGLDREGCCVCGSHLCGSVVEPKLLWVVPHSGHVRPIWDPFSFLVHSFSAQQASPCLTAVITCWACVMNYPGVPHDCIDTHNSTLPSRVNISLLAVASIASLSFSISEIYGVGG